MRTIPNKDHRKTEAPQKGWANEEGTKKAIKHSPLRMPYGLYLIILRESLCLHAVVFVRNSEFLSALGATCSQYSTTVGGSHSLTETVLVFSLSVRGLKCSFHLRIYVLCYYSHEFGLQK